MASFLLSHNLLSTAIRNLVLKLAPSSAEEDNEGRFLIDRGVGRLETSQPLGVGGFAVPRIVFEARDTKEEKLTIPLTDIIYMVDAGNIRDPVTNLRKCKIVLYGNKKWGGRCEREKATLRLDRSSSNVFKDWHKAAMLLIARSPYNALDTDSLTMQVRLGKNGNGDDDSTIDPDLVPANNGAEESELDSDLGEDFVGSQDDFAPTVHVDYF